MRVAVVSAGQLQQQHSTHRQQLLQVIDQHAIAAAAPACLCGSVQ